MSTALEDHVCDRCRARAAELLGHYPGIRARPPRWCPGCAGPALAELVLRGQVVTVTGLSAGARLDPEPEDDQAGVGELAWTVDKAARMLRLAQPVGSVFLRALVDEGGHATAARLRELTGMDRLNPATQTVNAAMRKVFGVRRLAYEDRHLARPGSDPENPRAFPVYDYQLPKHLVPILDEALRELGR